MAIILKSLDDTKKLATCLYSLFDTKMLITLNGDLAAGKTTFTKFFAEAMGIKEVVTSPTFNILKEYSNGHENLYHIDAYRLEGNEDELPFEDVFYEEDSICIVEWAEYIAEFLPKERLNISIVVKDDYREVSIDYSGKEYEFIESELLKKWQF